MQTCSYRKLKLIFEKPHRALSDEETDFWQYKGKTLHFYWDNWNVVKHKNAKRIRVLSWFPIHLNPKREEQFNTMLLPLLSWLLSCLNVVIQVYCKTLTKLTPPPMIFQNKQDWHLSNVMADAVKPVQKSQSPFCLSLFNKCHRYCTLSLKLLRTDLTPSSAISRNKCVLSEFLWAITHATALCSRCGSSSSSFLFSQSPPLFFCSQPNAWFSRVNNHAAARQSSMHQSSGERVT